MGYKPNNKWRASIRNADSKWEGELGEGILEDWEHHPEKIPYTIDHTYTPDFGKGNLIIEAKGKDASAYEWLSWNKEQLQGTFVSIPERLQIPENIKEQLIVELYSK